MVVFHRHLINYSLNSKIYEFKLHGVGFRGYSYGDRTILSIGYSHYVCLWSNKYHRCRRQRLLIKHDLQEKYQQLKFPDPYRQRGMQNLSKPVKIKEGKKK